MTITVIILTAIILILLLSLLSLYKNITVLKTEKNNADIELATIKNANTSLQSAIEEQKNIKLKCDNDLSLVQNENAELKVIKGKLEERLKAIEEQSAKMQEENELRFKAIAQEILAEKSKAFKEANESRLSEILTPFKDNIEQFKKTITENYINEAKERHSLQEHIKELVSLNQSIGKEAKDLTQALKGNTKMQGDWGEMILENILQKSGLVEGQEYEVQVTRDEMGNVIKNNTGNFLRPDVIVYLPDNKKMIIDSKVSLTAYVNFVNSDTKEDQDKSIQEHIKSIKNHINELKTKNYQDFIRNAGDFLMMFIPNEGAYISAMQNDSTLWQYAYDNRVVLISPTHLISALKLVNQLWQHDKQTKNAITIAEESGKLYDKFCGFVIDMESIAKNLKGTQTAFDGAMNKLQNGRGNLINQVQKLKDMGAKAKKSLPETSEE